MVLAQLFCLNQFCQLRSGMVYLGPWAIQPIVAQRIDAGLKSLWRQVFKVIEIDQTVAIIEQQVKTTVSQCLITQGCGPVYCLCI